ncbi:MAG TPA: hypothetical protein VF105_05350 [Gemmatimonadaceae bacterium]
MVLRGGLMCEVLLVAVSARACIGQVHRASHAGGIAGKERHKKRQEQIDGEQSAH